MTLSSDFTSSAVFILIDLYYLPVCDISKEMTFFRVSSDKLRAWKRALTTRVLGWIFEIDRCGDKS